MGGYYTAGETLCEICGQPLRDGDEVIVSNEATYDEQHESMDLESYSELVVHRTCYKLSKIDSLLRVKT